MSSAYILAERKIIDDAHNGIDTTGHIAQYDSMSPEEQFEADFQFNRKLSDKELLKEKADEVRRQYDEAMDAEDYLRAGALHELLNVIQIKYDRL